MPNFSRRAFLRSGILGLGSLYLGLHLFPRVSFGIGESDSPIRALGGDFSTLDLTGDEHKRPHDILWHLESYIQSKGGRPDTAAEQREVIIVGSGIAGLTAAHALRDKDWILLEQADRFGGNSRSEEFRGQPFSLGPAYITVPDAGSAEESLLRDLGLLERGRREFPENSRVLFGGVKNLWAGETGAEESARHFEAILQKVLADNFPSVPFDSKESLGREAWLALDRTSAEEWLNAQGNLHPHVHEYFQLYAWSAFGGSLEEISAAQFLNFVAAETKGVLAFPGGNGTIAEALYQKLKGSRLRSGSMVLEVKEVNGGVEVLAEDASGALRRLQAKALVMAAPKYAARRILKGLSPERDQLWKSLGYRAYSVANVLLEAGPEDAPAFDLYAMKGAVPETPSFGRRTDRPLTDFVFSDWAGGGRPRILTIYRPFPFEGARNNLLGPGIQARLEKELREELKARLPEIGISADSIRGVRISLWGHSVPLARKGLGESLEAIGAPFGDRIYFANQDNFMNPSFESCVASANLAAAGVRAILA